MTIRKYEKKDLSEMIKIWNEVVEEGNAFPQETFLDSATGENFFAAQSFSAVAEDNDGSILGLYILHPNNIGRCGHIANASYAVSREKRGRHTGEALVKDSLETGRKLGFKILQFNAVVATNIHAINLYKRLGFCELGKVPGGYKISDKKYEDIILFYHML